MLHNAIKLIWPIHKATPAFAAVLLVVSGQFFYSSKMLVSNDAATFEFRPIPTAKTTKPDDELNTVSRLWGDAVNSNSENESLVVSTVTNRDLAMGNTRIRLIGVFSSQNIQRAVFEFDIAGSKKVSSIQAGQSEQGLTLEAVTPISAKVRVQEKTYQMVIFNNSSLNKN